MVKNLKFSKISVIIPAYYEKEFSLRDFVEGLDRYILEIAENYEIIIVCSKDIGSLYHQAESLSLSDGRIWIVTHDPKIGREYAYLLEGFEKVTGDYVLFIDPFSKLKLENLVIFKNYMLEYNADVVIGSKSHIHSKVNYSFLRKIASRIYYWLLKKFFGLAITDAQTGFKLYKTGVLKDVLPRIVTKKYTFDLEVLACANHLGYKIVEAPVHIEKNYKFELITPALLYYILVDTIAIYYRLKILKFYDRKKPPLKIKPPVSILIATKGYNQNLKECISACKDLDYPDFEIIILPDEKMATEIEGIKEISTGPLTPPEKRDIGLKYAKGDIVAFLDDDAFPAKGWIKNAVRYFDNEEIAAVGGPAVTPDNSSLREKASGTVYASRLVAWKNNYRYIPKVPIEVDDYPTCNLFIRKDCLEKVGGFGSKFWPGEDTIICHKIIKELGKKIYYDPDVLVYHKRRPLYLPHLKQVRNYALHRGYFVKRYPKTSFRLIYFFPSLFLIALLVGWIFAFFVPFFKLVYLSVIAIYLIWLLWITILSLDLKIGLMVSSGIFLTHIVYGFYFLKGLFSAKLPEEKEVAK
jgi:cellulose synthase/poly-beta-1,6-N-acetylglucosamine synthase-like glycosyltransferase